MRFGEFNHENLFCMVLEYNNIHITKVTLTISFSQHLSKNHFLGAYYMAVCVRLRYIYKLFVSALLSKNY